jgi:hypothetical protein
VWAAFAYLAIFGVGLIVGAWIQGFDKKGILMLTIGAICIFGASLVPYYAKRIFGRVPLEFVGFSLQLMSVLSPMFRIFARSGRDYFRGRPLDEESLAALESNPVFRLFKRTVPNAERLLREAHLRIEKRDRRGESR